MCGGYFQHKMLINLIRHTKTESKISIYGLLKSLDSLISDFIYEVSMILVYKKTIFCMDMYNIFF